jgi:hypothetical protein
MLSGGQFIGPVPWTIVMTMQARFVSAAQEGLFLEFGGILNGLAEKIDEDLSLAPTDSFDPLR